MKSGANMKKILLTGASFLMFAFTMPAAGGSPAASSQMVPKIDTVNVQSAVEEANAASISESAEDSYEKYVNEIYDAADLRRAGLKKDIFKRAMVGFYNLKSANLASPFKSVISIVDFNKSGKHRRFWTIDLKSKKLLYYT